MQSLAINYLELIKLQFSILCPQGQVLDARRDLGQGLAHDILDDGCDESIGSGHSHRDVNVGHEVEVIFANSVQIDFRDKLQGHRCSLYNQIVEADFDSSGLEIVELDNDI
jgi:hypothetical protein